MASSSGALASTKRRSQSSPELLVLVEREKKNHFREVATRSLELSPMDINQITSGGFDDNVNDNQQMKSDSEDPPIPVDAVTVIAKDSSGTCSLEGESLSIRSTNSSRKLETNTDNEKQKVSHIQNGAFAHQEANVITVEYDSSDDSGEESNKNNKQRRSRFDQWTNKFRTLFRGKDKDNYLDDKENRVQEASDSDDENCVAADYNKCQDRSRSQSLYGCLRKYVRNKEEGEKASPPSCKKKSNKSSFPTTFFPKRNRSRSRSKKSKQTLSEKQSKSAEEKASEPQVNANSSGVGHYALSPIEQAELLDTGLPLPSGSTETQGVEVPSQVEVSNNTIVTQDLYGQFGSHTQNGFIPRTVHTQIDYIHCLVPKLKSILDSPCYWGKIDRYKADALLENKPEGTYLLRDSAQEEFLFSVSFRRYGRSLHARLEQWSHRFSFDAHDPGVYSSDTVTGLLEHYKDPNCCMFFEPMLTTPLPRPNPHSLKELCRGVVCSNITYDAIHCLNVPQMFKEYLREYHYKQRVRVRRFEIDYLPQTSGRRQTVTNTCISY